MRDTVRIMFMECVYDIICGVDKEELEWVLKDFEEDEMYLECAGIKKALDLAKGKTIDEIEEEYLKLINKEHERQINIEGNS